MRTVIQRERISGALENVPAEKMYAQCLWLENDLLPRIEKIRGNTDADYKFFREVYKSLLWAIVVLDRYESLAVKYSRMETLALFFRDQEERSNRELKKFELLEELILTDGLDRHIEAVTKKVESLLNKK